ncbi:hypothetical protein Gotur_001147 [Gossypium turneri]
MAKKHLKVRVEAKRLKAEMGKVREDQLCVREEQTKLITRFGEIERQYNELQQEAELIAKQSAMTGIKLRLMLGILKAREGGDLVQAADLTRFLGTDNPEMAKKHLKVRTEAKRLKTEMGKVREDQLCLIEEQSKLMTRFGEIERQCNELKQEAQMMAKQSALTRLKLELMLGILKAREGGDLVQAANLTRFLRKIVAMEKANAILAQVKDEEDEP